MQKIKYFLIAVLVVLILSNTVYGIEITASINKINDNDIEFLLGQEDGIKIKNILFVARNEEWLATVEVTNVGQFSSWGKIIEKKEGAEINSADLITNINYRENTTSTSANTKSLKKPKVILIISNKLCINGGKSTNFTEGQELIIKQNDAEVGKIKITTLGDNYSTAEIISSTADIKVGFLVSSN